MRPLKGVRDLRERRMLSQQELADRAGVSLFTVQRIERGEGSTRPKTGRAIAGALGVDVEDLLGKVRAPPPESDYGALLKELGYPREQLEGWRAENERDEEFIARELEKMSAKDFLEVLIASPGTRRLRDHYRDNDPTASKPPRSETA